MEDLVTGLLWMLVLFGLPELLRRRKRPKEYEYPIIPEETGEVLPETGVLQTERREFIVTPPALPEVSIPSLSQPAPPLTAAAPVNALSRDLQHGMAWHVLLSPPVCKSQATVRRRYVGLR